jgi:UDP-glucose 4-epimerase
MTFFSAETTRPAVLVTGGAGFIGSHLVDALLARGERVRVLDDLSSGSLANLAQALPHVELTVADLRDLWALPSALHGVSTVFHFAAAASVTASLAAPQHTLQVNAGATLHLLQAAAAAGVARVVLASSAALYAESPLPLHEQSPLQPRSPYAVAKLAAETTLAAFARRGVLETVALRFFNVYGPRQDGSAPTAGVIARFCRALARGEPCTLSGDGRRTRDFVYVSDVVAATLLAAEAPAVNGLALNVARGEAVTLQELLAALGELGAGLPAVSRVADRAVDALHSQADIRRAQQLLGYRPQVPLAAGLAQTLAWQRAEAVAR